MNKEELTKLKNQIFFLLRDRGYEFKPKHLDYITSEEALYIRGLGDARELIFDLLDGKIEELSN